MEILHVKIYEMSLHPSAALRRSIAATIAGCCLFTSTAGIGQIADAPQEAPATIDQPNRPQTPKPPFPYNDREVSIAGSTPGVTLAGTLTAPRDRLRRPALLLLAGSGPVDRDETAEGHRLFLVLADALTRQGFVVLRYDKRGAGKSTGDFRASTITDFTGDARAAIAWLRSRPEVDPDRIGVIGHSEGGAIAALLATGNDAPAVIVSMAGLLAPGYEQIIAQEITTGRDLGADSSYDEKVEKFYALAKAATDITDPAARLARMQTISKEWLSLYPDNAPSHQAAADSLLSRPRLIASPWFAGFLKLHAADGLRGTNASVLLLNGSTDQQVLAEPNLAAGRRALGRIDGRRHRVERLPGLNHLFQRSATGSTEDYSKIAETISPVAIKTITEWLDHRLTPQPIRGVR